MKTTTPFKLLIIAFGSSVALFCHQVRPMSASDPRIKTLTARAAEARAGQLQEVTFAPGASIPAFVPSLEFAAAHFSVLTGRLSAKQVVKDERNMETWYVLEIDETLSEHRSLSANFGLKNLPDTESPEKLLPLAGNRLLLLQPGGQALVDGVMLTQRNTNYKLLELNRLYLFILEISGDHRLARLPINQDGVFEIGSDGESLESTALLSSAISDDIKLSYSSSLERVQRRLSSH